MEAYFAGTMWTAEHKDGRRFEMSPKEMEEFLKKPPKEEGEWCLSEFHEPFGGEQKYYTSRGISFTVDAESVTPEDLVQVLEDWTFAAYRMRNEYDFLKWIVLLPMSGPAGADDYDLMIHWLDRLFREADVSGYYDGRYELPHGGESYLYLVNFSGRLSPHDVLREEKKIVAVERRANLLASVPEEDIREGDFQRFVLAEIRQMRVSLRYLEKTLYRRLDRIEAEVERILRMK